MSNQSFCNHKFVAGKRKGEICGRFCRGGGDKCWSHKKKILKCDKCDKEYTTKSGLNRHIYSSHNTSNFKCIECDEVFILEGLYQAHMNKRHNKNSENKCKFCEKIFSTKGNLDNHILYIHTETKKYKCEICNKDFIRKGDLTRHNKVIHQNIKYFKCNTCNYVCSTKGDLNKHIEITHNKNLKFECKFCNHKFGYSGDLKRHLKICDGKINCSSGEYKIMKHLDNLQINYNFNSSYELKNKNNQWLKWDFKLVEHYIFIEYNGRQHYESLKHWGGDEKFIKQKEHDKLKTEYCKKNNYSLLWISHKDFDNIENIVDNFLREQNIL